MHMSRTNIGRTRRQRICLTFDRADSVLGLDGRVTQVRYKVCSEVEGREKLLAPKIDSLWKHAGSRVVILGVWKQQAGGLAHYARHKLGLLDIFSKYSIFPCWVGAEVYQARRAGKRFGRAGRRTNNHGWKKGLDKHRYSEER